MMNEHRASHVSSTGRRTQTKRKPRITPSAKLDLNGDQQYTTRNQILSPSHSLATTPIAASNVTTSPPQISRSRPSSYSDKDRAKSDDGFHSDSDKDSNHSNISVRQSKKNPVRSSSLNKLEPSVRIRTKTSSGSISDNVKIGSTTNRSMTNDRSAEEAKQERKIADLEISIKSLMKINAELDETNKKQVIEIQELKRKLRMSDTFMFEIYDATEEDCASTPSSELDFEGTQKDNDIRYRRICLAIDEMLQTGKAALEHTPKIGGTRVLTEAQINIADTLFPDKHNNVDSKTIGDTHSEAAGRRTPTLLPHSVPTRSRSLDITKRKSNSDEMRRSRNSMKTFASSDNLILANSAQNKLSKFDHDPPDTSATSTSAESNIQTPLSSNESSTPSSISGDSAHELRDARVRAIIDELLIIAKHPSNTNSLTPPQTPGREGLGWLLSNQDAKPAYFSHRTNSGIVESPAIPLLYELKDLLGYRNDAMNDGKDTKNYRKSMPATDVGKIHVTPPDEEHLDRDNNRIAKVVTATSQIQNLSEKQKLIRRRSSPSFRASEEKMNSVSERIGKGLSLSGSLKIRIDEEDEGEVNKGLSWMSSLRFLTPWKAAD